VVRCLTFGVFLPEWLLTKVDIGLSTRRFYEGQIWSYLVPHLGVTLSLGIRPGRENAVPHCVL
jgi:hypothetical protein